ncbi:MAG: exosortase A [Emcibacter sp.]|nr:exosortase A [Emcibacter sp.]
MADMQLQEIKTQWRNASIALSAVTVVVLVSFFDTVKELVLTWWDKPEYNHCLLILPIIIYLIYERREIFHKIAPGPSWLGLLPLLGGGGLWLLGDLADTNVVRQFGLIIILQGCILTILGKRVFLGLLFPIFYMVFLVPFGDFLVPALQDFTTVFVIMTLNLFNIPVFVEGVFLSIAAGDFHVAEACAGLRFLVATVALGTLMANVAYKTWGRQVTVVILSFLVPILANGLRASGIILVAHWSDMKYATGVDHLVYGWIFFAVVLLIFISIAMTFTNRGPDDGYIDFTKKYWSVNTPVSLKKFILPLIISAAFVVSAPFYISVIEQRYQAFATNTLVPDEKIWGSDNSINADWKPQYHGASQIFHMRHEEQNSEAIDIYIAYYKYQSQDAEMIRFGNGVVQQDIWARVDNRKVTTRLNGTNTSVNEILLQSSGQKRLVWYWYWVDGRITASNYKAKILDAKAKLLGGRLDSAVIALSLSFDDLNIDQKRAQLAKFAASLPPLDSMVTGSP